jgi:hypothetical protein
LPKAAAAGVSARFTFLRQGMVESALFKFEAVAVSARFTFLRQGMERAVRQRVAIDQQQQRTVVGHETLSLPLYE